MKNNEIKFPRNFTSVQQALEFARECKWTTEQLDELSKSNTIFNRIIAVEFEYGLERLKNDPHSAVRSRIARKGYYLHEFKDDKCDLVRKAAYDYVDNCI